VSSLLQILECILEKVSNVFLEEVLVRSSGRRLIRRIDRFLDLSRLDKEEHARQQHGLRFEAYQSLLASQLKNRRVQDTNRPCGRCRSERRIHPEG